MATTDKPKSNPISSLREDIPAEAMTKLQAAYQALGISSTHGCPDPETVIVYAMGELIQEKRAQVYAHLLECKDCLSLVLDLRAAWAEAQAGEDQVRERSSIRVQAQSWLAGFVDNVMGSLSRLLPVPRLIPLSVALVVLVVVGLGVFQHLKAPTSSQRPVIMANLRHGSASNYQVRATAKVDKGPLGAPTMVSAKSSLTFLPLLLGN